MKNVPIWLVLMLVVCALAVIIGFTFLLAGSASAEVRQVYSLEQVKKAIRIWESNDDENCKDGDKGASIGPYQIQKAYWQDANMPDGSYQDCRNREYAGRVFDGFMKRHEKEAISNITDVDAEVLARAHNGGPNWRSKKWKTDGYWKEVKRVLRTGKREG